MGSNRYKTLATDTVLFALSNFGSKILTLLLVPLYTNILSTTEYGVSDLIATTVNLLYPILTLAISEGVLRYAAYNESSPKKVISNALALVFLSTAVLAAVKPLVEIFTDVLAGYWWYFVVIYFLFNLHLCISNYTKAIGKTKIFAIQGIVQTAVLAVCNILFLLVFRLGISGYLTSIIAGYVAAILIMVFFGQFTPIFLNPSFDRTLFREMLIYSIPMIPNILLWWINTSSDKYMIIGMVGVGASGIYSVAHKIPTIISTVTSLFNQAWLLSAIKSRGEADEEHFYTSVYMAFYLASIIFGMMLIPLSKQIAGILFAKEFFAAWRYTPFLIIAAVFSGLSGFLSSAFRAAKCTKELFKSVSIGAVVNIVLNFILIRAFGAIGAAVATMCSFAIVFVLRAFDIKKIVRLNIPWRTSVPSFLCLMLASAILALEVRYALIIYTILLMAIVLINFKDLKAYGLLFFKASMKLRNKANSK